MPVFKTVLYDTHKSLGATIGEINSFSLPLYYKDAEKERRAVREAAGLFDLSFLGEILITKEDALKYVDYLIPNKLEKDDINKVVSGLFINDQGGIIDLFSVYPLATDKVLLVINAENITFDNFVVRNWRKNYRVKIQDVSGKVAQIAVQGPLAEDILSAYLSMSLKDTPYRTFFTTKINDREILISRSGYTGEDGFELFGEPETIKKIFTDLLNDKRIVPCGMTARDALRFEAGLVKYNNEISSTINPFEANLSALIKMEKKDFLGKEVLARIMKDEPQRTLVGLVLNESFVACNGDAIMRGEEKVGFVATSYLSSDEKKVYATAIIDKRYVSSSDLIVKSGEKTSGVRVVRLPFYRSINKR